VEIELQPPPPIPAMTRPSMSVVLDLAKPQAKFPAAKTRAARTKLAFRPNISLNFPESGCVAVSDIRYPEPSHEMMVND